MKKHWETIKKYKFIITFIAFVVWVSVLDASSLLKISKQEQQLKSLNKEIEQYKKDIERLKEIEIELNSNLEKFAREEHYMKEEKEDVFIVIEK